MVRRFVDETLLKVNDQAYWISAAPIQQHVTCILMESKHELTATAMANLRTDIIERLQQPA